MAAALALGSNQRARCSRPERNMAPAGGVRVASRAGRQAAPTLASTPATTPRSRVCGATGRPCTFTVK